jgi:hypothetical protein
MKKILCLLSIFLSFNALYAMETSFDDDKQKYAGLIPRNAPRHAFNKLESEDNVSLPVMSPNDARWRHVVFSLKGLNKEKFKQIMPGSAWSSHKQNLELKNIVVNNNILELTYEYRLSRLGTWGFAAGAQQFSVQTVIPANYPNDFEELDDEFEDVHANSSDYEEYIFVENYGSKLKDKAEKKLLIKYSGLIPVEIYRNTFNDFKDKDTVVLTIKDKLTDKYRRVSFNIDGDLEEFRTNIRPSNTSVVSNFSYLDLISIEVIDNNIILEFAYWESPKVMLKLQSQSYYSFKVKAEIPKNYPNEDLKYMTQELIQEKVNKPIDCGILAGLNARDVGKHFGYEGLVLRSQYLSPEEIKKVNEYFGNQGHGELKTMMNLNIHGFGGGPHAENYSMKEIHACEEMGLTCLYPYHKNPQLRAYVDGEDPRTIPTLSRDRGNVFNATTVKYFIDEESRTKLGLVFDETTQKWGFDNNNNFEEAILEGNVIDLFTITKNFINAGLPAAFHCKGGIHRTGQVEAVFMLLFALKNNEVAMWSEAKPENLNDVCSYRFKGYFSDAYNYLLGLNDKNLYDVLCGSFWENKQLTPLEWNYVLSSQKMPRKENIMFIRDLGAFVKAYEEDIKNNSAEEAYTKFLTRNIDWVTKDIFMAWYDLTQTFNSAVDAQKYASYPELMLGGFEEL